MNIDDSMIVDYTTQRPPRTCVMLSSTVSSALSCTAQLRQDEEKHNSMASARPCRRRSPQTLNPKQNLTRPDAGSGCFSCGPKRLLGLAGIGGEDTAIWRTAADIRVNLISSPMRSLCATATDFQPCNNPDAKFGCIWSTLSTGP